MNKLGIKLYKSRVFGGIYHSVNSVKHHYYDNSVVIKFRIIDSKIYNIRLFIKNKKR